MAGTRHASGAKRPAVSSRLRCCSGDCARAAHARAGVVLMCRDRACRCCGRRRTRTPGGSPRARRQPHRHEAYAGDAGAGRVPFVNSRRRQNSRLAWRLAPRRLRHRTAGASTSARIASFCYRACRRDVPAIALNRRKIRSAGKVSSYSNCGIVGVVLLQLWDSRSHPAPTPLQSLLATIVVLVSARGSWHHVPFGLMRATAWPAHPTPSAADTYGSSAATAPIPSRPWPAPAA